MIATAPQKYTEARKLGNRKWDAENLDRISIALPKGAKDTIKTHAAAMGESVNGQRWNRSSGIGAAKKRKQPQKQNKKAAARSFSGSLFCVWGVRRWLDILRVHPK